MLKQIDRLLDEQVRPALASHGGNVELVDIDNGEVFLRLTGGCHGCSSSQATVQQGIEKLIQSKYPFISKVIDVTDHSSGENPYM